MVMTSTLPKVALGSVVLIVLLIPAPCLLYQKWIGSLPPKLKVVFKLSILTLC